MFVKVTETKGLCKLLILNVLIHSIDIFIPCANMLQCQLAEFILENKKTTNEKPRSGHDTYLNQTMTDKEQRNTRIYIHNEITTGEQLSTDQQTTKLQRTTKYNRKQEVTKSTITRDQIMTVTAVDLQMGVKLFTILKYVLLIRH